MTFISRLTCGREGSRWNGVGSTRSIGSAASSTVVPPNGSRYAVSTAPPSASTSVVSCATAESVADCVSDGVRPMDFGVVFFRRFTTRFFAMGGLDHGGPRLRFAPAVGPARSLAA